MTSSSSSARASVQKWSCTNDIESCHMASGTSGEQPVAAADGSPAGEDLDDPKPPGVDVDLQEAERILMDYISLLPKNSPMLVTRTEPRP